MEPAHDHQPDHDSHIPPAHDPRRKRARLIITGLGVVVIAVLLVTWCRNTFLGLFVSV